jgi:ectoine hydroxylase-related dioxygenase (phytanoyl-CoA dioxygenase family)
VAELANDRRLLDIARAALGLRAIPFRATLFDKSPRSNWSVVWHQDTALPLQTRFERDGWRPWSVKNGVTYAHAPTAALEHVVALRVHLDDSTAANGPLRVIAGTHRLGVLSDDDVASTARASAAVDCVVARGGVLAMRPLLVHSSARVVGAGSRRVLHIEYTDDFEVAPGIFLATA